MLSTPDEKHPAGPTVREIDTGTKSERRLGLLGAAPRRGEVYGEAPLGDNQFEFNRFLINV